VKSQFFTFFATQAIGAVFNLQQAAALTTTEIVAKAKPAVVVIEQIDTINDAGYQGTGWFYDSKTVITNAHILKGTYSVLKVYNVASGKEYTVDHINYLNVKDDVAALTVREENDSFLTLASVAPLEGNNVTVIGNPKEHFGTVTTGIVSAIRTGTKYGPIMQVSAPISHGSSGSPVLNDNGEVIGMVWGGDPQDDAHDLNYAVPQAVLQSDLFGVAAFNLGGPLTFASLPTEQNQQVVTNNVNPQQETFSSLPKPTQFGTTRQGNGYTFTKVLGDKQAIIAIASPVVSYLENSAVGADSASYFMQNLSTFYNLHDCTYERAKASDLAYFKQWPVRTNTIDFANIIVEKIGWDGSEAYMVSVPFNWTVKNGKKSKSGSTVTLAYVMPSRHTDTGIEDYFITSIGNGSK
jgi:hypothetical protein